MVHRSLVAAENALSIQSQRHPDGWGLAYYVHGAPHLVKSPSSAESDQLFHRLSGIVSSETVVAHVRKATVGPLSVVNSHPFQHGRWVLAHNGTVPKFDEVRARFVAEVDPRLARFILGDTDSEVIFFLFLTHLARHGALADRLDASAVTAALRTTVARAADLADRPGVASAALTLLVTDGSTLAATRNGRSLFWSSFKRRCPERAACTVFSPACEAASADGRVNHFIVSSEPLGEENVWTEVAEGQVVGVDAEMRLLARPVAA